MSPPSRRPDGAARALVCPTCQVTADGPAPTPAEEHLAPASWSWADPAAARALRSRRLGEILRAYRGVHALTQEQLAARLGYDKTYVSMIETGRRVIHDVPTRRHIAAALAVLARAWTSLGVCLGTVLPEERLPEERLPVAVAWTGKDVAAAAQHLHDPGDIDRFTRAVADCHALVQRHGPAGTLVNPFTLCEIHLRGLLELGDVTGALALAETRPAGRRRHRSGRSSSRSPPRT